jgi:hypothetical protein
MAGRQGGKAGHGVFEDRQQAVEEQRDQRRLLAKADGGHGERQHRDRRKCLADIHQAARQGQEFRADWPGDKDGECNRNDDRGKRGDEDRARGASSVSDSRLP